MRFLHISMTELRPRLTALLERVEYGRERVLIKRHGKVAAMIVPVEDIAAIVEADELLRHGPRDLSSGRRKGMLWVNRTGWVPPPPPATVARLLTSLHGRAVFETVLTADDADEQPEEMWLEGMPKTHVPEDEKGRAEYNEIIERRLRETFGYPEDRGREQEEPEEARATGPRIDPLNW